MPMMPMVESMRAGENQFMSHEQMKRLQAKKAMGKEKGFKIINVQEDVMEIFEMVGFLDIITFG